MHILGTCSQVADIVKGEGIRKVWAMPTLASCDSDAAVDDPGGALMDIDFLT